MTLRTPLPATSIIRLATASRSLVGISIPGLPNVCIAASKASPITSNASGSKCMVTTPVRDLDGTYHKNGVG